ncbi:hypothetical protein [Chryseolinea soli]|uniref:Uncharacterized protein n=1 Tax=Chryseolinea soli TaxID=2321403 RepID=A0A385SI94_9BACT|nr:hypothetical protein [Chryseolinea soli]AYB30612.1 hypothetical protein D4L85_08490 [Chryseolinea soli]
MNIHDEEMQKNLEAGQPATGDEVDAKAYRHVFDALRQEPEFVLPHAFANRVVRALVQQQTEKTTVREYVWFGVGIVLLLAAFITAIVLTDFKFNIGVFSALRSYRGLFLFAIVFITLLHLLDRRLLRNKRTAN